MNLSHAYGKPVSAEQGERVLLSALDAGVTLFDTATLYGFGANETLLGRVLKPHRQKITLASKCGMQGMDVNGDGKLVRVIDGRPATLRKTCEDSLRRLQTDVIDLYYLHRWDKTVPIEESVGALGELVRKGYIRSIGLSEVSAATLRRAHAEHPIAALQTEYSLWTRNPEIAVLDACKELGVLLSLQPGGGAFCATRCRSERWTPGHTSRHAALRPTTMPPTSNCYPLLQVAQTGCTPAQLALPGYCTGRTYITHPGTTSLSHLTEDLRRSM
jgi:aryl-alcohol dehydrogenase-like predicted oxidoreductase